MRLSEAIRLGSMLKPQGFGDYGTTATCAWGAAFDAIGVLLSDSTTRAWQHWPWAVNTAAVCPHCSKLHRSVEAAIVDLNDNHAWTRERIADWVATVEPVEAGSDAKRAVENDGHLGVHAETVRR